MEGQMSWEGKCPVTDWVTVGRLEWIRASFSLLIDRVGDDDD